MVAWVVMTARSRGIAGGFLMVTIVPDLRLNAQCGIKQRQRGELPCSVAGGSSSALRAIVDFGLQPDVICLSRGCNSSPGFVWFSPAVGSACH